MNWYNEIDPYCAEWLRNLIAAGEIPLGVVDERSIEDILPSELGGYTQCHFFAGLGGWSLALRLAGWPDDRPVWTGSCPCQPFSAAGKGAGFADQRHLWPAWFHLISECRPAELFGEQVANAAEWLGLVFSDLEALDYVVGGVPIEAASAGAYHLRDRLWFVAHASGQGLAKRERERGVLREMGSYNQGQDTPHDAGIVANADVHGCKSGNVAASAAGYGSPLEPVDCFNDGNQGGWFIGHDGKARRVEPGIRLLAHGIPARVGKLRALGNAIDTRPATAFIRSCLDIERSVSLEQMA